VFANVTVSVGMRDCAFERSQSNALAIYDGTVVHQPRLHRTALEGVPDGSRYNPVADGPPIHGHAGCRLSTRRVSDPCAEAARRVPDLDGSVPSITVVEKWFTEFANKR
jgi:hypothetical protein